MALDTPLHRHGLGLERQLHLLDLTVTCRTSNAFIEMDAVVEIDKIRQVVDAAPFERFPGPPTGAHRLQHRAGVPDLGVAIHTGRGWGNIGK